MSSVAEHVSADGALERIEFVPGARGHLYAWLGQPAAPGPAVLICSSICADFTANYHRERLLARALLGRGIAVARFHYFGEGNSDGDARDVTLPSMIDDATAVLDHLESQVSSGPIGFVGTRLGALVAAAIARRRGAPLALWEPLGEPLRFFDEAFRAKRMSQVVTDTGAAATWREELDRNGVLDLLGYRVYPELVDSLEHATPGVADPEDPSVFVARFERRLRPPRETPASRRPAKQDTASFVVPESWWFHDESVTDSGDLIEVTARWLEGALSERGSSGTTGSAPQDPRTGQEQGLGNGSAVGAIDETPVFFDGPDACLAGVLTVPPEPNGLTVLLPWGSGAYPSSGRNRIRARLARAAAAEGFHAFRFDYSGRGESGGNYREGDLDDPFDADIEAACRLLAGRGLDRVVIVANCLGAWSALAAAPRLAGLEGMAIVRAPVGRHHYEVHGAQRSWREWLAALRRVRPASVLDPRRRALHRKMLRGKIRSVAGPQLRDGRRRSPFSRSVEQLVRRRVPVLLLYSIDDDFHRDLQAELDAGLSSVLDQAGPRTRLLLVNERLKGLGTLDGQDRVVKEVTAWLRELRAP